MKEAKKRLILVAAVAFIGFLITYAKTFYDLGTWQKPDGKFLMREIEGFISIFIFPVYYAVLTVVAIAFIRNVIILKRPYIVTSSVVAGFLTVIWIIYICVLQQSGADKSALSDLWYIIVITILSLFIIACYISIAIDIAKTDKRIKQNNQNP